MRIKDYEIVRRVARAKLTMDTNGMVYCPECFERLTLYKSTYGHTAVHHLSDCPNIAVRFRNKLLETNIQYFDLQGKDW